MGWWVVMFGLPWKVFRGCATVTLRPPPSARWGPAGDPSLATSWLARSVQPTGALLSQSLATANNNTTGRKSKAVTTIGCRLIWMVAVKVILHLQSNERALFT